jgi:hypothetical protein
MMDTFIAFSATQRRADFRLDRLRASLLLVVALAACRVTLIGPYDAEIDRGATRLQRRMDAFLTRLENADTVRAAGYAAHRDFYTDYAVDLRSMLVRAESHPENTITEEQLRLMLDSLAALRAAHEAGPLDPATIATARDLYNQSWRAILTVELAKKRGTR